MRSFLALLCLLGAVIRIEAAGNCNFSFPSTADPSRCELYDLSKIASLGGANFTGAYNYVLTVCENLPSSSIPEACSLSPPSPAYQYFDNGTCVSLGDIYYPFAVSI